jgi:transposase
LHADGESYGMPDFEVLSREELIAFARQVWEQNLLLQARVAALEQELERLRKDPPSGVARSVPAFVKPNRPPREKKERKKRSQSFVRRRQEPTEVVEHALERCPGCGQALSGGWVHHTREVIEIPETPVRIVAHQMIGRHCGRCKLNHVPCVDFSQEVVGQHRVGVRLMSLIGYLKTTCRLPVRKMRAYLKSVYGLSLSDGEIVEALHTVAHVGEPLYGQLREVVRQSEFVNADETGWREDGENGYLWSFSTPSVRLFKRDKSRGHQVPEGVLGEAYAGILCSDFYSGYNYHLGLHQRCWVHYLRDLHKLKEEHSEDSDVLVWVEAVVKVYEAARNFKSDDRRKRIKARECFQERLLKLGRPYAQTQAKQSTLAERIMRYAQELFTFVEHPQVPSENNAAERAIRPAVIDRKVTGGTRSPKGSRTKEVLMTLFGTWHARELDVLEACQRMLTLRPAPT